MFTAIYARQSIEKQDSVSIDTQIEKCELICKMNDWEPALYSDAGYSGSNINRPGFEHLLEDIRQGKVSRVIAYRLDRISRSITDFASLLQLFQKYHVQFMSATENFDTSSPLGRAMVYIVMVFAQLERETIIQRITDNYYFRAKQGLFTGGNCPLGYTSAKMDRGGKKASVLEADPKTAPVVKEIFDMYTSQNMSLHKIAVELNSDGVFTQKGASWTANKLKRILRNPAYVANDISVYEYFSRNGFTIANSPGEFDGVSGLVLVGKEKGSKKNRKVTDTSEQILAVGGFQPLIRPDTWLHAQYRLQGGQKSPRSGSSKTTWLSGLLSCGVCGYSMSLKFTKKRGKDYLYIHCRGRSNRGTSVCSNAEYHDCRKLEQFIQEMLFQKISSKDFMEKALVLKQEENMELTARKNSLLAQVYSLDHEIKNLMANLRKGSVVIDRYLTEQVTELDEKKCRLLEELATVDAGIHAESTRKISTGHISSAAGQIRELFSYMDVETKHLLASALVKRIILGENRAVEIDWYF